MVQAVWLSPQLIYSSGCRDPQPHHYNARGVMVKAKQNPGLFRPGLVASPCDYIDPYPEAPFLV